MSCLIRFVCLAFINLRTLYGWNEWLYNTTWSSLSSSEAKNKLLQWENVWYNKYYQGSKLGHSKPPRPRRGHSMHLIITDPLSDFKGDTYIVMFGGRDNDQKADHKPKTYNVETVRLNLKF